MLNPQQETAIISTGQSIPIRILDIAQFSIRAKHTKETIGFLVAITSAHCLKNGMITFHAEIGPACTAVGLINPDTTARCMHLDGSIRDKFELIIPVMRPATAQDTLSVTIANIL